MATAELPIRGPSAYSDDWHALRIFDPNREPKIIFGASDAAAICGMGKYAQPLQVYRRCAGIDPPFQGTEYTDWGKRLESAVLEGYADTVGRAIRTHLPMFFHPHHEFMGATPDALAYRQDGFEAEVGLDWSLYDGTVDAKTTSFRTSKDYGDEGTDEVPNEYLFQAQQQMAVTGLEYCDFAVLSDLRKLRVYKVTRNQDLIDLIAECEKEMLERLEAGDPPEPQWEHKNSLKLLQAIYGDVVEQTKVELPTDIATHQHEYNRLNEEIKELKRQAETHRAHVVDALGVNHIGDLGNGRELVRSVVPEKEVAYTRKSYIVIRERAAKEFNPGVETV